MGEVVRKHKDNVFCIMCRDKKLQLPEPTFVVFYNGEEKRPEMETMRLSDLFVRKSSEPNLELVVKVYNINKGYNDELLGRCESLRGYMVFVNTVREYKSEGFTTKEAVEASLDYCMNNNILVDFFAKNRKEILDMSIFEFDEELYEKAMREDGIEEGFEKGHAEGHAERAFIIIKNMLSKGLDVLSISDLVGEDVSYVERIQELFLHNPDCVVEELYSMSK